MVFSLFRFVRNIIPAAQAVIFQKAPSQHLQIQRVPYHARLVFSSDGKKGASLGGRVLPISSPQLDSTCWLSARSLFDHFRTESGSNSDGQNAKRRGPYLFSGLAVGAAVAVDQEARECRLESVDKLKANSSLDSAGFAELEADGDLYQLVLEWDFALRHFEIKDLRQLKAYLPTMNLPIELKNKIAGLNEQSYQAGTFSREEIRVLRAQFNQLGLTELSQKLGNPFRALVESNRLVWRSVHAVSSGDVQALVDFATRHGRRVHINTGTHGDKNGNTVVDNKLLAEAQFSKEDLKIAWIKNNVSVHIVSSLAPPIDPRHIDRIDAWCFSEKSNYSDPALAKEAKGFVDSLLQIIGVRTKEVPNQSASGNSGPTAQVGFNSGSVNIGQSQNASGSSGPNSQITGNGNVVIQEVQKKKPINLRFRDPSAQFTGRTSQLADIKKHFETHSNQDRVPALFIRGTGGLGKTQLALKYAQEADSLYKKKYFIDCCSKEKFEDSLRSVAMQLGIDSTGQHTESLISEIVSGFKATQKGLIIVDNVDNKSMFELMAKLLPEKNNHVIITGRYYTQSPNITEYPMEPFSLEDSKELVIKMLSNSPELLSDETELEDFVKQLRYFPLSIKQAVSLIQKQDGDMSLREYTDLYLREDREEIQLLLDEVAPDDRDYVKTAAKTYLPDINEVVKQAPSAQELLRLYAYFGSSGEFPAMFFENDATYQLLMPKNNGITAKTAVARIRIANSLLAEFSLISCRRNSRGEKVLEMHEILRKAIRLHTHEKRKEYLKKAIELFNRGINELYTSADETNGSAIFREYPIQFSEFVGMAKKLGIEQQIVSDLLEQSPLSFKMPVEFGSPLIQNLKHVDIEELQRFLDFQISQRCKLIETDYEQLSDQERAEFDSALKSRSTSFAELLKELKRSLADVSNLTLGIAHLVKGDVILAEALFKGLANSESLLTKIQALNNLHIISLLKGDTQNHEYLNQANSALDVLKSLAEKGRYHGLSQGEAAGEGVSYGGWYIGGVAGTATGVAAGLGMAIAACMGYLVLEEAAFAISCVVGAGCGVATGAVVGTVGGTVGLVDGWCFFDPKKLAQIRDQLESKINYLEEVLKTNRNTEEPIKSKL